MIVDAKNHDLDDPAFRCIYCRKLARPNVLMFGKDNTFVGDPEAEERFAIWKSALMVTLQTAPKTKVAVIEIGVGTRVPKLANICMDIHEELNKVASDSTSIIRINLEVGVSSLVSAADVRARAKPALCYLYTLLQQTKSMS